MTGPADGLGCPWDLALALTRAASLEQVAAALTAVLARHLRAGTAALLLRTRGGVRVIDARGDDQAWLTKLTTEEPWPEPCGIGPEGDVALGAYPPDGAMLTIPCAGLALTLALRGADLDLSWLRANQGWLAQSVRAAVARAAEDGDEQQALVTLSHEMRTPLTTIKGYASSLLRDDVSWEPSVIADYARLIDEETDSLIQMISEILETSIQQTGSPELLCEPVLLDKLTLAAVAQVERRDRAHIYVRSLPASLPPVLGDPVRLRQVLANLLDNAVKYASPGLVVVSAYDNGDEVVVSVADEGPGLRPEHVNRLFERYFRVTQGPDSRVVGTGLGLPLARGIVERLGGRIWATSEEGKGTTISFTVPKLREQA